MDLEQAAIVRVTLTPEQVQVLTPILVRQRDRNHGAVLALVSSSYEPLAGSTVAKLDVAWLPWKLAEKVCRLIRESAGASEPANLQHDGQQ
jgi:hypothetical protein